MLQKPLLKLRNLKELQSSQYDEFITPFKVRKARKPRSSVAKTKRDVEMKEEQPAVLPSETPLVVKPAKASASAVKRSSKSVLKEPPPNQLRIDKFFKTCPKNYKIEPIKEEPTPISKKAATLVACTATRTAIKKAVSPSKNRRRMGRKRLFVDETSTSGGESASHSKNSWESDKKQSKGKLISNACEECINLISDGEEEKYTYNNEIKSEGTSSKETKEEQMSTEFVAIAGSTSMDNLTNNKTQGGKTAPSSSAKSSKTPAATKGKPKPCPPYKIVEGTSFAVDAFQYGYIAEVSHYFLTHFHADHYIGLTRKFAMPLYMSTITARLVRTFIPLDEQYIHELELNSTIKVNGIEITALDANHCPGAVMLLFKFPDTGKCILHTGDFRAWYGMESEPVFWNNDIHTIYLDTTYISQKYAFCTQYESISRAKHLISEFQEKHAGKRILYICGSYVIGKEKFWSSIAEEYELKVWTEANRGKAIEAMEDEQLNKLLVDDPRRANMHVISMGKLSYLTLVEYFFDYEHEYDILLAIRPSGWEKGSKPQYRGKINIVGVEYSEHSSYEEMQRFVKFLKPEKVISTVPTGRDLMKTAIIPDKWYKYDRAQASSNYQPCIEQFLGKTPKKKSAIRLPNEKKGGLETFVSPIKTSLAKARQRIENNNNETLSIMSSEKDSELVTLSLPMNPLAIPENTKMSSETEIKSKKVDKTSVIKQVEKEKRINIREAKKSTKGKTKALKLISQTSKQRVKKEPQTPENRAILSTPKALKSTIQAAKQRVKKETKTPENGIVLILSQSSTEEQSCSIFTSKPSEIPPDLRENSSDIFESFAANDDSENRIYLKSTEDSQSICRTNSSDYFEGTSNKTRNRRCKNSSTSKKEIIVSQKRNTRLACKKTDERSVSAAASRGETFLGEFEALRTNLCGVFKRTTGSNRKCRSDKSSASEEKIVVSQKRNVDRLGRKTKKRSLSTTTNSGEELEVLKSRLSDQLEATTSNKRTWQCKESLTLGEETSITKKQTARLEVEIPKDTSSFLDDEKPLKHMEAKYSESIRKSQINSLLKSTTTSYQSSADEEVPPLYASKDMGNSSRLLRSAMKVSTHSYQSSLTEQIPASQTTVDLNATPRPLRNKMKAASNQMASSQNEQIAPSQTTAELENTPRPLRNKMKNAYLWQVSQEEVIPASQTSKDLENTPRPIRNKRSTNNISNLSISPTKRSRDNPPDDNRIYGEHEDRICHTQSPLVTRVMEQCKDLDVYNTSQLTEFVSAVLAEQIPDRSVDHIPSELLSDQDADDDWLC